MMTVGVQSLAVAKPSDRRGKYWKIQRKVMVLVLFIRS